MLKSNFECHCAQEEARRRTLPVRSLGLACPSCGNTELADPKSFNLLFETNYGMHQKAYLRPETAQVGSVCVLCPQIVRSHAYALSLSHTPPLPGHLRELSADCPLLPAQAAVRSGPDRKELSERDLAGERAVPNKGVLSGQVC